MVTVGARRLLQINNLHLGQWHPEPAPLKRGGACGSLDSPGCKAGGNLLSLFLKAKQVLLILSSMSQFKLINNQHMYPRYLKAQRVKTE